MKNDAGINDFLICLARGLSIRKLYFAEHKKVIESAEKIAGSLQNYFRDVTDDELFVGIVDGSLVYNGRKLTGPSVFGHHFVDLAHRLNCGGFTFKRGVSIAELTRFINLSAEIQESTTGLEKARQLLLSKEITGIEIAYHFVKPSDLVTRDQQHTWLGKDAKKMMQSPALLYQALFDVVSSAHGNAAQGRSIDLQSAQSVSEYLLNYSRSSFSDIMQHIRYPDFDTYTVGHSVRVATLAVFVGTTLKLNDETLLDLGTAGLLHDVGKSQIPEEVLFKPGQLSSEEYSIIKEHAVLGVEILLSQNNATSLVIAGAWGHHVRHDGGGYPATPSWMIRHPLTALLQICDVFEALTAVRPYKPPLSPHEAYSIMIGDKGAFHPGMLAHFMSVVGIYPPGNLVALSDGRHGIVVANGEHIDRPEVEIFPEVDEEGMAASAPVRLSLGCAENQGLYITGLELEH